MTLFASRRAPLAHALLASTAVLTTAIFAVALTGTPADAGPTPSQKCQSSKLKTAGKKGGCRGKAASKAVAKQVAPDYSKCTEKFDKGFDKAESKGGNDCPSTGDAAAQCTTIETCLDDIVLGLGDAPGADAAKCRAAKMKAVGKYFDCLLKAESKAAAKGGVPDTIKCTGKFNSAFPKAEAKGDCTLNGDVAVVRDAIELCTADVSFVLAGNPTFPDTAAEYVAGKTTYVDSLVIPEIVGGLPTCCHDFGEISRDNIESGTDNVDNALAQIAEAVGGFAPDLDFNQLLADAIAGGDLVLLFDHRDLADTLPDPFFTLVQFLGEFDNGTTPVEGALGTGEFLITPSSFVPGTGEPVSFTAASITPSLMDAGPFSLDLTIPFGFLTLNLTAVDAAAQGVPGAITAAGVPYTGGEISGYILQDDIYATINALLNSPQCACLGLGGADVYVQQPSGAYTGNCVSNALTLCPNPDEELCVTLAGNGFLGDPPQVCTLLPGVINPIADINTTGDETVYEGLSVGLLWSGQNAQINGVATTTTSTTTSTTIP